MSDQHPEQLPPVPPSYPPGILPYAQAAHARPPILTAIGIFSIVIGSLGVLLNLCGIFQWVSILSMRSLSMTTVTPPAVVVTTAPSQAAPPPVPPDPAVLEVEPDPGKQTNAPAAGTPAPATIQTVTITQSAGNPFATMPIWPSVVTSLISLIESALGAYLLFAGIQLLRNSPASRKHHLRYAAIKIPVAILSAVAAGVAVYEMQRAVFNNMQVPGMTASAAIPLVVGLVSTGVTLLLSIAYPVALLITLTRPKVRGYFENLHRPL